MWEWIIFVLIILALFLFIIIVGLPPKPITTGVIYPPCDLPLEELPEVSTLEPCLNYSLQKDSTRFYDPINNWTVIPLDPSIAPSAQQVCIEYCPQVQLPSDCISQNTDYLNCLNKLKPVECHGPVYPAARSGTTFYYVIGRGKVSCY